MSTQHDYDVIVIGAGPTGENVASRAAQGGLSVAVVERELVGGECSYWACMPSKALLRPGHALAAARKVEGAKQAVTGELDKAAVLARRDSFTSSWDDSGQVNWLEGEKIALIRGHGRISGDKTVEISTDEGPMLLHASTAVVVAVGSGSAIPPVPGLAEMRPWTTREATSAKTPPQRLVVMGGGVAGCELAQAWSSLGSQVTIVEAADRLLATQEPFVSDLIAKAMSSLGIEVRTGKKITAAERLPNGVARIEIDSSDKIECDELLVAVGRKPRTDDLGLETIGLKPGSWLDVDDTLAVKDVPGEWLYAVGDINHRALLTHQGKYQARVCGDVIVARTRGNAHISDWSKHCATADHHAVPSVVFTDPEVASVGMTEANARAAGVRVRVVDYELGNVAGASLYADGYEGKARIVVNEDARTIVGATFVGPGVSELLHSATIAVVAQVPLERLWHAVPSFPTISEVWLRLLEAYGL